MRPWQVDKHIDTSCPGEPRQQPKLSRGGAEFAPRSFNNKKLQRPASPLKAPERLPSVSYSLLNDNMLRKKMGALGISTGGNRQLLERRHKEWVTIWNANCDSAHPKRMADLLHDLDGWERTLGGRAPTMSHSAIMGAQIKDKNFDASAWSANHDSSFRDLVASARKTRLKAAAEAARTSSFAEESRVEGGPSTEASKFEVIDLDGPSFSQAEIIGPVARGVEEGSATAHKDTACRFPTEQWEPMNIVTEDEEKEDRIHAVL